MRILIRERFELTKCQLYGSRNIRKDTDRVVERKEVPLFDNKAFREAIINAVLHNKWVEGNEPMISVFYDRIEILSRGTLASVG